MKYWLVKSEPDVYSIDDFKKDGATDWEGVRNYQARNFMWKDMQAGDLVLFYHSSCEPPGVAGLAEVLEPGIVDKSGLEKGKAPTWYCAKLKFVKKLANFVTLESIKSEKSLQKMRLIQRGNRLSVMPVEEIEFQKICEMGAKNMEMR